MADPITPEILGAIACIKRKLDGSSFCPTIWTTLAESGTADTPAAPKSGFILCFKNMFIIFAKIKPDAVAIPKDIAPKTNIPTDWGVRKTSA